MKEETVIGSLFDKAEAYGETSVELMKLKAIETSVDVASGLTIRIAIFSMLFLLAIMLNISVALWLGEQYGALYVGFLLVSLFDFIILTVIYLLRKNTWVENRINNMFLQHMFKKRQE